MKPLSSPGQEMQSFLNIFTPSPFASFLGVDAKKVGEQPCDDARKEAAEHNNFGTIFLFIVIIYFF